MKKCLLATFASVLSCFSMADNGWQLSGQIELAGPGRWDYLFVDESSHRLYVAHGTQVDVLDTNSHAILGTITGPKAAHGIAIAADAGRGFITSSGDDQVHVFALDTLKIMQTIPAGKKPDAIVYEPASKKVVVFDAQSNDLRIMDPVSLKTDATLALGSNPEFAVIGSDHTVYFNLEGSNQLATLDVAHARLTGTYGLGKCEEPSGLAVDPKDHLYAVCKNHQMTVTDSHGKVRAEPAIGAGPDGVAFMDGYAFSANGADGTLTVVNGANGQVVATVKTEIGARTIVADPEHHRLYLPTARFKPSESDKKKREVIPDSFHLLVVEPGKQ